MTQDGVLSTLQQQHEKILNMFWEYAFRIEQRYKNEIVQIDNNVHFRDADDIDMLNKIKAHARYETARDICKDIATILQIGR